MAEAAQAQGAKKTFHLEIVTPDKQFFIGEAEALVRSVERSGCPGHFKLGARRALRKLVPVPGEIW